MIITGSYGSFTLKKPKSIFSKEGLKLTIMVNKIKKAG
jgi:hypothetical protein